LTQAQTGGQMAATDRTRLDTDFARKSFQDRLDNLSFTNQLAQGQITAQDLFKFNIIDEIIKEPAGGAHRDPVGCANSIKSSLLKYLEFYNKRNDINIRADRKEKFMKIGKEL
jgi:acetyl-CoA carboxylase alpha subunit